jgi:pyruvate/2-oxoacid:ferredoxin oxidoreductase alpha subunit
MKAKKGQVKVITGNAAAAYAVMICRPDAVTSYPIPPMSAAAEQITSFHADGLWNAEMVEVEGENSAMNVVAAASITGARAFTVTSSWGL